VAARCCGHLLRNAGLAVNIEAGHRARVPAILLSDAAMALLRDVFGNPALLSGAERVRKRIVAWGIGAPPVSLDHAGYVVPEEVLLGALGQVASDRPFDADWTIYSSRSAPAGAELHTFGTRVANSVSVELTGSAEPEACWVESLESGWLFLITAAPGSGWLLAVGGDPQELLAESRLVAAQIARCGSAGPAFPAAPGILAPLCGSGWLACGTAAMGFDPICGDGTANAVREAILASAVIRSAAPQESLLAHYEARLRAGFRRHLELCLGYYTTGGAGEWWVREAAALRLGIGLIGAAPEFRYRLRGFDLQQVGA
jgi:hypothetical protein